MSGWRQFQFVFDCPSPWYATAKSVDYVHDVGRIQLEMSQKVMDALDLDSAWFPAKEDPRKSTEKRWRGSFVQGTEVAEDEEAASMIGPGGSLNETGGSAKQKEVALQDKDGLKDECGWRGGHWR